jgi:hypothetical protein
MEKLNVLLAKTDHLAETYRGMIRDFMKFFSKSQGAFKGERKTYSPKEGTIDMPNNRVMVKVQTTVSEKLDWFIERAAKYVDAAFSVELTNAASTTTNLIVGGEDWGTMTSLELLRLKSILENGELHMMLQNIPVRSDSEVWVKSTDPDYDGREVWETPKLTGVAKTTEKESYILPDPNLDKLQDSKGYTPQLGVKNTVIELGDYTHQRYSGELSQRDKALMLERRDDLLVAVIEALKKCNEVEAMESKLNAKRVFGYIFKGN